MYSVHSECWYITLHAGQCVVTHPDLPELHGGAQQHPVHLRGGLHPAAAPLLATGGPRYSGHEPQSVQSLLQSSSSVNEMWDSTVYYILQETNDEYYLVNIQVLHQTYTTYMYVLSKQKKSVTDWILCSMRI